MKGYNAKIEGAGIQICALLELMIDADYYGTTDGFRYIQKYYLHREGYNKEFKCRLAEYMVIYDGTHYMAERFTDFEKKWFGVKEIPGEEARKWERDINMWQAIYREDHLGEDYDEVLIELGYVKDAKTGHLVPSRYDVEELIDLKDLDPESIQGRMK